ncbi:fumarylacetoacetase [Colletotrichum navitas]|uniref:Fumarylacetoacetase n=1 Tax=Colletotrichum navitas TaxID=681940 RepID=A0AAD8PWF8_9PEZI|nr:fumarylacetoacetase [Colletotrichum navitas]KAK1585904.1 fumarylacetoacetase [Colletotrichum navitas]
MSFSEHFSIANIPFGIASTSTRPKSVVTRVEDSIVFLSDLGLEASENVKSALCQATLNDLAAIDKAELQQLRKKIQQLLSDNSTLSRYSVSVDDVQLHLPISVQEFSSFACFLDHIKNVKPSILPLAEKFPISYVGRSSSIVSGGRFARPYGLYHDGEEIIFGPSRAMDYELEVACIIGKPTQLGTHVSVSDATDHIFGLVLMIDWSARDIQSIEMGLLGPMNGKSFGTSISPWVVTLEALEAFATPLLPKTKPSPPYLSKEKSSYDVTLQAEVLTEDGHTLVCKSQLSWMHWTFGDIISQHTVNGCNLRTGDVLSAGTVSGTGDNEHGCLLELTNGGKVAWETSTGQKRIYLQDSDGVRISGYAGNGVGFGDCLGFIDAPKPLYQDKEIVVVQ